VTEQAFDTFSRRAAGISRRGSLMTLGGAGLAAMAGPASAEAGKSDKKANRKARKKGKKKCKKQDGQCIGVWEGLCAAEADPELCQDTFLPCCAFLASCQATAYFACVFATVVS
jgi:hypothetical protein